MERIVREFSEVARLPKPQPGALSLASLVEEVVGLYRPEGVTLTLRAEPDLPSVRADREQITQVLVNLLQIAFDAARVRAAPLVSVQVARVQGGVALYVDDNGPGIAASQRERIFEPYVTTKPEGTGLGLSIVKRIVADHGAVLTVADAPLGGARFTVLFREGEAAQSASMP
jgi:nitrogen fixation/metabolism regulation signal transduction histidine kinase